MRSKYGQFSPLDCSPIKRAIGGRSRSSDPPPPTEPNVGIGSLGRSGRRVAPQHGKAVSMRETG